MKKIITVILLLTAILSVGFVAASEIKVPENTVFYIYDSSSLASEEGYDAAIIVDGDVYYLDKNNSNILSNYSQVFKEGMDKQPNLNETLESKLDKPVKFTYKTGIVGLDKKANIIDNLTLND